ncbi:glycosyltransferase family 39 protein [Planctomycetes bacterium K23_9]|uniref:Uncharacterized protein n=1 Tax=Stieleria marina TaxID=1930275 RepID=A0A517P3F5_9BACT|nr:hypothetical protein K239x_59260 [Planctomycetes bacterium K23_9]
MAQKFGELESASQLTCMVSLFQETTLIATRLDERKALMGVFAFAIAVRAAVLIVAPSAFSSDPDAYRALSQSLAQTGVFGITLGDLPPKPTAFRPPLYPYLLSWLTPSQTGQLSTFAVGILHVVMGALTSLATTWVASRLIEKNRIGKASIVAGLLVAIDPILVQQSTQLMTETIATLLSISVIAWWVGRIGSENASRNAGGYLVLSLLLALAYLCRPTFLVWAVLLTLASFFAGSKTQLTQRFKHGVLTALLVVVALAGWSWRNASAVGHPIWATSHGGYTLLLANNESFYDYLRNGNWGEAWDAKPFLEAYVHRFDGDPTTTEFWNRDWSDFEAPADSQQPLITEQGDDRRCYLAARATIDRQPTMFLYSCLVRVGRLWSPMPHVAPGRSWAKVVIVGLYYSALYVAVAMTLWRLRRRVLAPKWWAILALAITLCGVHAIYWTNFRMRAPIIPATCLLAAGVIVARPEKDPEAGDVADN